MSSTCYADEIEVPNEESASALKVQFMYGLGGPERKMTGFLGERIQIRVELPQKFSPSVGTGLLGELTIVSRANATHRIDTERPIVVPSLATRNAASFLYFTLLVPPDFEEGEYDMVISVQKGDGAVRGKWKGTIELYSQLRFGIRHLTFRHGVPNTERWVPGSNIFVVGQTVGLIYELGGLSVGANQEVAAEMKLVLVDQEGVSVNALGIVDRESLIVRERVPMWVTERYLNATFTFEFPGIQAGDFVFKIEAEDLNSGEKGFLELPFHVIDPATLSQRKEIGQPR